MSPAEVSKNKEYAKDLLLMYRRFYLIFSYNLWNFKQCVKWSYKLCKRLSENGTVTKAWPAQYNCIWMSWPRWKHQLKIYVFLSGILLTCSPSKVNWHFGGTWRPYVQGRRIKQAIHLVKQVASRADIILRPWTWRRDIPPKRWLTFNGLHGVVIQKA